MKNLLTYAMLVLLGFAMACQQTAEKEPTTATEPTTKVGEQFDKLGESFEKLGKEFEKFGKNLDEKLAENNKKMDIRRGNGDTTAMHYNQLKAYLPKLNNYIPDGKSKGEITRLSGFSYSKLEQNYKTIKGKKFKVNIIDYNGAFGLYSAASAMLNNDLYIENENELIKKLELGIQDVIGVESYKKKRQRAKVVMGVGGRFLVTIIAEEQEDAEFAKLVAKDMPLLKMSLK